MREDRDHPHLNTPAQDVLYVRVLEPGFEQLRRKQDMTGRLS